MLPWLRENKEDVLFIEKVRVFLLKLLPTELSMSKWCFREQLELAGYALLQFVAGETQQTEDAQW